jgi:hypothetical protein
VAQTVLCRWMGCSEFGPVSLRSQPDRINGVSRVLRLCTTRTASRQLICSSLVPTFVHVLVGVFLPEARNCSPFCTRAQPLNMKQILENGGYSDAQHPHISCTRFRFLPVFSLSLRIISSKGVRCMSFLFSLHFCDIIPYHSIQPDKKPYRFFTCGEEKVG